MPKWDERLWLGERQVLPKGNALYPSLLELRRDRVLGTLDLTALSMFFGLRSKYLKMEQILLHQRLLTLLLQRSSREVLVSH